MRPVIHRDGTFECGGHVYCVLKHGPQWGYEIVTWPDLRHVADGYLTMTELRDDAERACSEWRESQ